MTIIAQRPDGNVVRASSWTQPSPPQHRFLAAICEDKEDGGYYGFAINYPGVISQGDSLEETTANIGEAFLAMLESRKEHGESMRFSTIPVDEVPATCRRVWITVDG